MYEVYAYVIKNKNNWIKQQQKIYIVYGILKENTEKEKKINNKRRKEAISRLET